MDYPLDTKKSLQELEDSDWGDPPPEATSLERRILTVRRKPLRDFTPGDLRITIGQRLSLEYLVPLAIDQLEESPLVEGDYYPGDLLSAVGDIDSIFWQERPDLRDRLEAILLKAYTIANQLEDIAENSQSRR